LAGDPLAEARQRRETPFGVRPSKEEEEIIVEAGKGKFVFPARLPNPKIGRIRRTGKYYNQEILEQLAAKIGPDAVVVDANAGFGNETVFFAVEAQAKKIYAFEGDQQEGELLKKNIELNELGGKVILHPYAISDSEKMLDAWRRIPTAFQRHPGGKDTVPAKPLDAFSFEDVDTIALLRIGGRHAAKDAVDGAKATLAKSKFVYVDVEGRDRTAAGEELEKYGFTPVEIDGRGRLYMNQKIQD
jgi:FkbM family methyltransferase